MGASGDLNCPPDFSNKLHDVQKTFKSTRGRSVAYGCAIACFKVSTMEDCRESLDGEPTSGEADEVSSNLDVVELESRPSSSSTLVANATTTTQQISALPRVLLSKLSTSQKPAKSSTIGVSFGSLRTHDVGI